MKVKVLLATALLLLGSTAAFAMTNIAGTWVAEQQGPQGTTQITFQFNVDGDTLTGTVSDSRGENEISEGAINGDEISFVVVRTLGKNEIRVPYKGKISGNEIKFTMERPNRNRGRGQQTQGKPYPDGMGKPASGRVPGQGGPGGRAGRGKPGGAREIIAKRVE